MYLVSPNWSSWYRLARPVHPVCLQCEGKHGDVSSVFPWLYSQQSAAVGRYLTPLSPSFPPPLLDVESLVLPRQQHKGPEGAIGRLLLHLLFQVHWWMATLAGGEIKRPGALCHVPIPIQEPGMALDENQLLHFPKPLLRWDWVHHLYQHQCEVCTPLSLSHVGVFLMWPRLCWGGGCDRASLSLIKLSLSLQFWLIKYHQFEIPRLTAFYRIWYSWGRG